MISYKPFWDTLKKSSETTYTLMNKYNINSTTIQRIRNNQSITLASINDLCEILNCKIEDIVVYTPSNEKRETKSSIKATNREL